MKEIRISIDEFLKCPIGDETSELEFRTNIFKKKFKGYENNEIVSAFRDYKSEEFVFILKEGNE